AAWACSPNEVCARASCSTAATRDSSSECAAAWRGGAGEVAAGAGAGPGERAGGGGALPQGEGVLEHRHGVARVPLLPGQREEFLEPVRIQKGSARPQGVRVAQRGKFDPVGGGAPAGQQGTYPRHMSLNDTAGVQRWRV